LPATLRALVDSLRFDPFYVAISQEFGDDEVRRREALARYFDYSMCEADRRGKPGRLAGPIRRCTCLFVTWRGKL